ncbi:uncharacterized protein LOC105196070 isoform X2 [Solenopsis invicta]|uniref:uncharacterized protein LOC105196070 isoform X2 n=1 Tax=Solenopsis invicta TaxID=13686 RepID=UPI00193CED3C|nr:uncharacterized protein LOC105196070 isoform X2 [Solenopsis invicta]
MRLIAEAIFVVALSGAAMCGGDFGDHALFVRTADVDPVRQQQSESNGYLPPYSTQRPPEKPRPFQTASQQNEVTGYPAQRPSSLYTPPNIGYPGSGQPSTPFSTPRPSQQPSSTYVPQGFRGSTSYNPRPSQPSYTNAGSSAFPPLNPPESSSTYLPPQPPPFPSTSPRLPSESMIGSLDSLRPSGPPPTRGYPSSSGGYTPTAGYPSTGRPQPSFPTPGETGIDGTKVAVEEQGPRIPGPVETSTGVGVTSSGTGTGITSTGTGTGVTSTGTGTGVTSTLETDENQLSRVHVHEIKVECSKEMMTVNVEFNTVYDGLIYSKGYFMNPECTHVKQNSGLTQYSFTLTMGTCGTQFISDFEGESGQAYLENVLVLQNEPGIQEVWDKVQRVRCLWEGNISKLLQVNLSVDMLKQEIVTFSGDTATAKLDIQMGKGPFAPAADGLVKIGEPMTLVISVEGDPGFDLQVRECMAKDEASENVLQLTDERGCVLKTKLFGAFQKTTDTGNTGASIIAYAFFNAFKFPDVMDLFIECNIELCKTNCESCPEPNQQIEPNQSGSRRRRSITYTPPSNNSTNAVLLSDPVRVGRRFKVIMLDDLSTATHQILESMEETAVNAMIKAKEVCMSNSGFYTTFSLMLSTIFIATISTAVLYIKLQRIRRSKFVDS